MKKLWGYISLGFAKTIDAMIKGLVFLFELITNISEQAKSIIFPLFMMVFAGMFMFPPLLFFLFTGPGLILLLILSLPMVISFLGKGSLRKLYQWQYATNKFLYAYADDMINNTNNRKDYSVYKQEYIDELNRKFEEQRRREEEARRRRQQAENERWEKIFEEYFNTFGRGGTYSDGRSEQSNTGGYQRPGGYNPFSQFKAQYEQACDVLGVPYNSDYSEIKSAYRRLAKRYHPDLSQESNAEEMFKKVNNAFEFLSEENVRRYKNM